MNQKQAQQSEFYGLDYRKQTVQQRQDGLRGLRQRSEQEEGQEEEKGPVRSHSCRRRRWDGTLLPGPVAQRGAAAGDAHWVHVAGAELLVARGGDEASPGGRAGLPIMYPCK